jgi:uncharacterized membrane protein
MFSSMHAASKLIGLVCVILTIILWAITLATDRALGSILNAVCLTAIVAIAGLLSLRS